MSDTSLLIESTLPVAADPSVSDADEARAFWRIRHRMFVNNIRQALQQSRLRVLLILALSTFFWMGLFVLFIEAFRFLSLSIPHAATRDETVRAIFGLFFSSLTVMLVFSSGIIMFGSLYRSRESEYLMTMPVRPQRIFLARFQEAVLFSSWGFLLLGSPMLTAYGLIATAPWYYYALLLPAMVAFVFIPCGLGAIACMVIVWRIPSVRVHAVAFLFGIALLVAAWTSWSLLSGAESDLLTPGWFEEMVSRLRFSEHRLLPNWWLSTGVLEAARGEWSEAVLFLALLIANALAINQLAIAIANRLLRPGYTALAAEVVSRRRISIAWVDRLLRSMIAPLSPTMSVLIVKDVRLFRRDPVQWSQFLIFVGLLALYFANIRRFRYDVSHATWINLISFLNITVVGLILSTFTSRFIFPMISLEGRRFWILGLLPIHRDTILWSKFWFASSGLMFVCTVLVVLSDMMLRVEPLVFLVHFLLCGVLCTGLSSIAVGLGARLPNLREESPSKIAAGFGGTLNLLISAIYILVVVTLAGFPCHFYVASLQSSPLPSFVDPKNIMAWVAGGVGLSVLLGIVATIAPLRIGFRAFRRLEF